MASLIRSPSSRRKNWNIDMKTENLLFVCIIAGFLSGRDLPMVRADESTATDDPQDETKKLNDVIEKSIDWYEVFPDANAQSALRPQPVMRWRNVARGQEGEAMMVVWAHN